MNRIWLLWGILPAGVLIAFACSGLRFSLPARNLQKTPFEITTVAITSVPVQTPTEYPPGCYFNWAYKNLPELSSLVQAAVEELYPGAEAHAQVYGEDCIYADRHADFHAMETDFFITLPVADLQNNGDQGKLIRQTADLLLARFPTGETPGTQPGRFNFRFTSSGRESYMSFAMADYQKLPPDLTGADLMRALIH